MIAETADSDDVSGTQQQTCAGAPSIGMEELKLTHYSCTLNTNNTNQSHHLWLTEPNAAARIIVDLDGDAFMPAGQPAAEQQAMSRNTAAQLEL